MAHGYSRPHPEPQSAPLTSQPLQA